MYNLLKAELYKLKHSKELLICIFCLLVLCVINVYYGSTATGKISLSNQSREMFGLIICTLFAVIYVGKDLSYKTINHALTSGHKRSTVLLSKYIIYLLACVIILLINYFLMGGVYTAFYGWGQTFNSSELYFLIIYISIGIFFDLCILSIPFFICILIKNLSITIPLCYGIIGFTLTFSQMPWDTIAYSVASKDTYFGILPHIFLMSFLIITIFLYSLCHYYFNKQDIQ